MNKLKVSTDVPNEIHMTRTFDTPRHLVVQAMTTPELIKRWLGGVRATVLSVEVDLRVGGTYRYVLRPTQGADVAFGGVYPRSATTASSRPRRSTTTPARPRSRPRGSSTAARRR